MRPRVFPAEDAFRRVQARMTPGFNEAAGIPRGRRPHTAVLIYDGEPVASMRPRVFPAEDTFTAAGGTVDH